MEALTITKNELVAFLQENQFEHLSHSEQARLRDYLDQILNTLEAAAKRHRIRRTGQQRKRYQRV